MNKSKYNTKLSGHAVVFGASGDIGYEIVVALVAKGVTKISFTYGGNKVAAEALAAELLDEGVSTFFESVDLMDDIAVRTFLQKAVEAQGEEIIHMANAVGISPNKDMSKQTIESTGGGDDRGMREVFEVNVFSSFITGRAVAERMIEKGIEGTIVLITSTNGVNSNHPMSSHYDQSKSAQIMQMVNFAMEYTAKGVRVNAVAPGWVLTQMNKNLPEDYRAKESTRIWCGRWAEPHEIASVVAFLLNAESSYIYGQNIVVDGGYR